MRILFTLLALLPCLAFGQGFGSFYGDQPYLAKSESSDSGIAPYILYDVNLLGLSDGDLVSSLTDQTSKKYNALASGTARPYWTNNVSEINGEGYLYFDGIDDIMQTNVLTLCPTPTVIFIVANTYDDGVAAAIVDNGNAYVTNSLDQQLFTFDAAEHTILGSGYTYTAAYDQRATNWTVWELRFNSTNSYVRTNGAYFFGGSIYANPRQGITLGNDRADAGDNHLMRLAYCAVYTNDVPEDTASNLVETLGSRYGITIATRDAVPTWNPTVNDKVLSIYDPGILALSNNVIISTIPDSIGGVTAVCTNAVGSMWISDWSKIRGNGFVYMDGTKYFSTNWTTIYPQPTTVFMVTTNTLNNVSSEKGLVYSFDASQALYTYNSTVDQYAGSHSTTAANTQPVDWVLWEVYYNAGSSYMKTNNVLLKAANTGSNGRRGFAWFGRPGGFTLQGAAAWCGVYTNTLSATETSNVVYYLQKRFGF